MDNLLSISRKDSLDFDLGDLEHIEFTGSAPEDELDLLLKLDDNDESGEGGDFSSFEGFEDISSIDVDADNFTGYANSANIGEDVDSDIDSDNDGFGDVSADDLSLELGL